MANKAFKFRIYPNSTQRTLLAKTFGCVRVIWNYFVAEFNDYKKGDEQTAILSVPQFKQEFEWMSEVSAGALQQKTRDWLTFKNQFFSKKRKKKLGRPKFKSRHDKQSYKLPNKKFAIKDGKIRLEKIGWMNFDNHRQLPEDARLLSVTVSCKNGKYYAAICFEYENIAVPSGEAVGVDIGIKNAVTLSTGKVYDLPDPSENQTKIKKLQRALSRKAKGSNRRSKTKFKLAKTYEKLTNKREWYLHQISAEITDEFGDICLETLDVEGMKTGVNAINRALYGACISKLVDYLTYKAIEKGSSAIKVDKWFPSTQLCSDCGNQQKMPLSNRQYDCSCGLSMCRDQNAAINILRQAKHSHWSSSGLTNAEITVG